MSNNYEATIKDDDGIFSTLVIKFSNENASIFCGLNLAAHEATGQFNISPTNISRIEVTREGLNRQIQIHYSKFDLSSITSLPDKNQQILEMLNLLGYSRDKVSTIEYKKKNPNDDCSNEFIWVATIFEHYDPDESFSQNEHEISMSKKISNALGFEVKISMI